MSALRASPSPSLQVAPYIQVVVNKTKMGITTLLRNSVSTHNSTINELNMAMGDPNPTSVDAFTSMSTYDIMTVITVFAVLMFIGYIGFCVAAQMPCNNEWIQNKYNSFVKKEILPVTRPKKAKESPFVGPINTPSVLPYCPRLDGSEKGQNIMFRFRGPTNTRFESTNTSHTDNETRITIVAVLENNGRPTKV